VISSSQGLYLNTGQHKHRINTYTYQTSMPCVGFEPTIPASERAKTIHALDHSATVTGCVCGQVVNKSSHPIQDPTRGIIIWNIGVWTKSKNPVASSVTHHCQNSNTNSVALVRKRIIPTELPSLIGEVSANFVRTVWNILVSHLIRFC
jgi:hypothetical protein